ncbi:hypothetical protein BASA81_005859 [Batrachochytrium salamandrivorans]|nr:hypothetical protein BASA81_005859 [Batrachochytrium salamandrivorans]
MNSVVLAAVAAVAMLAVARRRRIQTRRIPHPNPIPAVKRALFIDDVELSNFTQFQIYLPEPVCANRLALALQQALELFPYAGGKFVWNGTRWDLHSPGLGIEFIHKHLGQDVGYSIGELANVFSQVSNREFALPFPSKIHSELPVVTVQLATSGEAFSVLTFSLAHFMFDGTTRYYFCKTVSDLCSSTITLPAFTYEIAMSEQELAAKLVEYKLDTNPYHTSRYPGEHVAQQIVLSAQKISELKQVMPSGATTHEIAVALLVFAVRHLHANVMLFNICNLRKRLPGVFPEFYLGNAAGLVAYKVDKLSASDTLYQVCEKLHASAKQGLAQSQCEQGFFRNEAYGTLVLSPSTRQQQSFQRVYYAPQQCGFLVNSWRHQDWYALRFGGKQSPLRVGLAPTLCTQPRYVHVEQCSPQGDIRLFAMLSLEEACALEAVL